MGDLIKKPYEISIWEDRLVTEGDISYYKETKLAVIGSDRMDSANRIFSPVLTEKVNGEKTLTFSLAYRYFDELQGEYVNNPFYQYLINERKVKLYYNDEWFDFLIKECQEGSKDYIFNYTAEELFSLELSKTGYAVTLDQSLNNNQGTVTELADKVLEDTDWEVDVENSDLLRQFIQEPLYSCTVDSDFSVLNLGTNETTNIAAGETIYVFYSYISNQLTAHVQFIRENDRAQYTIDDNNVIKSTNYRFAEDVTYQVTDDIVTGINDTISVDGLYFYNQGYRLVYGQQTVYDPVMERTVDLYRIAYDDSYQNIYHYNDYTYATSDIVVSYLTNGSDFNLFDDGQLQGWSNVTPISEKDGKKVLQPIGVVTRPEISSTSPLNLLEELSNINGYLQLKFNNTLGDNYENTFFNSGFDDNMSTIDHISAGETFALRLRYFTSAGEHDTTLEPGAPSGANEGIRVIVAQYDKLDEECYLDDKATATSKVKAYTILPDDIILDFNGEFVKSLNVINNGTFNESHSQYIVDRVVQTPSALYRYMEEGDSTQYIWDGEQQKYVAADASYADYYLTTAQAQSAYSNEQLHDPKMKIGIFVYTKDKNLVDKYIYLQDIQLTRYYENANGEPITMGNVPTAVSMVNDIYYLEPKGDIQQDEIITYGSLAFLAKILGVDESEIKPIYNERSEKILSIQAGASNCFNILQDLCEKFECWLDINVAHDDTGAIKLDKDFNPIKRVAFREYAGKENFSGFKNGINLLSIDRQIDSNEIVTKLIVEPVQSEYVDSGSVDIQSAKSNPSGESSIINLSYYLNRGLITDVAACNEDLLTYYDQLKAYNSRITDLNLEYTQALNALTHLSATRNVYTALIDEATEQYNQAIQDFYDLTGMDYDEYVTKYHNVAAWAEDQESSEEDIQNLVENDTVIEVIGEIYVATITINNYSGLLTNLNEEYKQLDLICNGAKEYGISVISIPGVEGDDPIEPSTQVVFDDYVSGVEFRLYTEDDSYITYKTSPNDRIFNATAASPYAYIMFVDIPTEYQIQYYKRNQKVIVPREDVIGVKFKINDTVSGETYNRRFKLIPSEEYAETYSGYATKIDNLIADKKVIQKSFYKKYSRFLEEGTWSSQDYIDPELYYLDALQVSSTSAQPKVSYTIEVLEVSQLNNLENYDFRVGDKTYIEDTDFFGYLIQFVNYADGASPLQVMTPVQEEVIVSEVEWHLDAPDENVITIQNYKTRFENLFQRISATVQTVQRNEITYPKTTSILDANGLINGSLLADSISGLGGNGFMLTTNGSITSTDDGLVIKDLTNSANVMRLMSRGLQVSTDGGQTWGTAINAEGISAENLTAGTINTQKIWLMDGDNPSFRWDKAGLNAYGLDEDGNEKYDLKTYVRFDKYGLYGIKNSEDYVASSLKDVREKAHFGVTWEGFFIKNSYTDGEVSITSDDDIVVRKDKIKKIHIGAVEKDADGAPTEYGIKIRNDEGKVVFETGDDGNLSVTGSINALEGNFSGLVTVGNPDNTHIIIDGESSNPTISSSNYSDGAGTGWIINGEGDATFTNVSVRGAIKTAVFEYEEIQAVGGAFLFRPSSTIKTARIEGSQIVPPTDEEIDQHDGEDDDTPDSSIYGDLILTVEKPMIFRVGNWVKISNFNSGEVVSAEDLSTYGLTHIYRIKSISVPMSDGVGVYSTVDTAVIGDLVGAYPIDPPYDDGAADDDEDNTSGEDEIIIPPEEEIDDEDGEDTVDTVSTLAAIDAVGALDVDENEGDDDEGGEGDDEGGDEGGDDDQDDQDDEDEDQAMYSYEIVLEGGGVITEVVALEDIPGGALIDFGNELGTQNYGIGINSSDNYVNLPARAISLFETTIHPDSLTKVTYEYKGILGTLPTLSYSGDSALVSKLYNTHMKGTQGIFTNNMYIGDNAHYIAFYTDRNTQDKKLRVAGADIIFTYEDEQGTITEKTLDERIDEIEVEGGEGLVLSITSSKGSTFDTSKINSVLTAHLYQNGEEIGAEDYEEIKALGYQIDWYMNEERVAEDSKTYNVVAIDYVSVTAVLVDVHLKEVLM